MEIILKQDEITDIIKNHFEGVNGVTFNVTRKNRDENIISVTLEVDSKKFSTIKVKTGLVVKPNEHATTDYVDPQAKIEEDARKGLMVPGERNYIKM